MSTDLAVQIHIATAMTAILLVPFVLWRNRRDRVHKVLGYIWVTAMAGTALSSFAITNFGVIGPFSPLHGLALLTLWTLFTTIRAAIRRNFEHHKAGLRSLVTFGLGLPMVLIFLPDRTFTRAIFDGNALPGLLIFGSLFVVIVLWRLWLRSDRPLTTFATHFSVAKKTEG